MGNAIVAIVVTYNRRELLEKNLYALLAQSEDDFDIFVIDNASTDGTKEFVRMVSKELFAKIINFVG